MKECKSISLTDGINNQNLFVMGEAMVGGPW